MLKHTADLVKYTEKFFAEIFENGEIYLPFTEQDKQLIIMESNYFSAPDSDEPAAVVPICSKSFLPHLRALLPGQLFQQIHISTFYSKHLKMFSDDNLIIGINWDQQGFGQEFQPFEVNDSINNKLGEFVDIFFKSLSNEESVYLSYRNTDNDLYVRPSYSSLDEHEIPLAVVPIWSKEHIDQQEQFNRHVDAHSEEMSFSEYQSRFLPFAAKNEFLLGANWLACDFGAEIDSTVLFNE